MSSCNICFLQRNKKNVYLDLLLIWDLDSYLYTSMNKKVLADQIKLLL